VGRIGTFASVPFAQICARNPTGWFNNIAARAPAQIARKREIFGSGQRDRGFPTMPAKQSPDHPRLLNVATVTLSAEFKIEIPQEMREGLGIKPGQCFQAFQFQNRIELIPWMSIDEARGMLEGIDTDIERER
jgi:bifunctional DNA-binding transcriptional regulator/antitoxin component of YhaV-PrlF toxin-antitoxin module